MPLISDLAAVVAPVFLLSLAGFVWSKRGLVFDQMLVTNLVTLIGPPAWCSRPSPGRPCRPTRSP